MIIFMVQGAVVPSKDQWNCINWLDGIDEMRVKENSKLFDKPSDHLRDNVAHYVK